MPTYNDTGIILNSFEYGEADKILNIYTKENGLVRAICKGVKKTNNRFRGKVDKLSCSSFQFAKGKNMDIVSECNHLNNFPTLRSDLLKLTYGLLFLEIVNSFAHEQDSESVEVYSLLYNGLDKLQIALNPARYSIKFITELLIVLGYKPQFNNCVMCSEDIDLEEEREVFLFSSVLGGLLCSECHRFSEYREISKKIVDIIENKTDNLEITDVDIKHTLKILKEYVSARTHKEIKSFDLAFSL